MSIFSCIENGSFRSIFRAQLARKNLHKNIRTKKKCQKIEFSQKIHFKKANFGGKKIRNQMANFDKKEISKGRILVKMRFQKDEFFGKMRFQKDEFCLCVGF